MVARNGWRNILINLAGVTLFYKTFRCLIYREVAKVYEC